MADIGHLPSVTLSGRVSVLEMHSTSSFDQIFFPFQTLDSYSLLPIQLAFRLYWLPHPFQLSSSVRCSWPRPPQASARVGGAGVSERRDLIEAKQR